MKMFVEIIKNLTFNEFFITVILSPLACAIFSFIVGNRNKRRKWINYKRYTISYFYIIAMTLFVIVSFLVFFITTILLIPIYFIILNQYLIAFLGIFLLIIFINNPSNINAKILFCLIYLLILFDLCDNSNNDIQPIFNGLLILISAQISQIILKYYNNYLYIEDKIPKKLKQFLIVALYIILQFSLLDKTPTYTRFFSYAYFVSVLPSLLIFMHDITIYHYSACNIFYVGNVLNNVDLSKMTCKNSYIEIDKNNSKICIFLDKIDNVTFYGEPYKITGDSYMYILLKKIVHISQKLRVLL